jgi:hypothetical protein
VAGQPSDDRSTNGEIEGTQGSRLRASIIRNDAMPSPESRRLKSTALSVDDVCELRCAGVHPVHCNTRLRASTPERVVVLACEHGADAHGFTPRWYTPQRVLWMTDRVKYRGPRLS